MKSLSWSELGVPDQFIPAPFPFLPVPNAVIHKLFGLDDWKVMTLDSRNTMEEVGVVYGATQQEAFEAADGKYGGRPGVVAVQVERK